MNEKLRRFLESMVGWPHDDRPADQPPLEHVAAQALQRLERLAQIGRMTAAFAHDVRTPLHVISSALETAAADKNGRPAARADLRAARRNCAKILEMLTDILEFAKGERGDMREHPLDTPLTAALHLVERTAAKHGVKIKRQGKKTRPVRMHLRSVEGVFFNLLNNALESMPEGGTLTVRTGASKGSVWASVKDTGTGMPPETLQRLCSPGYTTKESGSGMGLYLSRQVLIEHRARLQFASEEGLGTTATVRFQRSAGAARSAS